MDSSINILVLVEIGRDGRGRIADISRGHRTGVMGNQTIRVKRLLLILRFLNTQLGILRFQIIFLMVNYRLVELRHKQLYFSFVIFKMSF